MPKKSKRGFTLIELIAVIVIVGILALVAVPRFFDKRGFETRGFHDEVKAVVRYGHKTAIAQHRAVTVGVTTNQICLSYTSDGTAVLNPANGQPFCKNAPGGTTLSPTSFSFTPLGQPSAGAVTIDVTGDIKRTITVEQETGYVH
ncbi:MAG: type II secretion system protein [Burkholderiaceae bacterium]|nr:type II secretion system protein [Burkholderiaceae bacterium]